MLHEQDANRPVDRELYTLLLSTVQVGTGTMTETCYCTRWAASGFVEAIRGMQKCKVRNDVIRNEGWRGTKKCSIWQMEQYIDTKSSGEKRKKRERGSCDYYCRL